MKWSTELLSGSIGMRAGVVHFVPLVEVISTRSLVLHPERIPIDPLKSSVDHFIPGLGVDRATSGSTAHLATTYYYYPKASCDDTTCEIHVGFTASEDGGKTWTAGKDLGAGPMKISWLPASQNGPMLADYLSSSYVNGKAFGVFMVAKAPANGLFNEAAYTTKNPLEASAG